MKMKFLSCLIQIRLTSNVTVNIVLCFRAEHNNNLHHIFKVFFKNICVNNESIMTSHLHIQYVYLYIYLKSLKIYSKFKYNFNRYLTIDERSKNKRYI